jgi:thiamine biosynthesis lipoprotein
MRTDYENLFVMVIGRTPPDPTELLNSSRFPQLLNKAKELFDVTYGKFNVAIGAVSSLWHEARIYSTKYPSKAYIPTSSEIQEALLHTDIKALILDEEMCSVFYSNKKLSLDLGAVAKGYVTSILHERLIELGCNNFLINLGGNVAAYGTKPKNESWNVKIENPFTNKSSGFNKIIKVNNSTIVTSGSYQRNFTFNGTEYSHVIDSTNGYPANIFASVSIQAPASSSALADALSTALFCISYEDGLSLIEKLENIEALWIFNDGSFKATSGFGG